MSESGGVSEDLRAWLENLGLGKWAGAFVAAEVDLEAARLLDDADLRELGLPLGPRRKLLAAAAALPRFVPAGPAEKVERRQLTVLFSDMVGSTALSVRLDPEDMRDLLRRYRDAVTGALARHDGHVAKFLGDGVLAIFGWPRAYEDQAERAVRAGLAVAEAVAGLRAEDGAPLAARIGIATGRVVIADVAAAEEANAITGETPNLAARLQEAAPPGGVVICDATRRLIGDALAVKDAGHRAFKGFAAPVPVWRVTGAGRAATRFEAARAGSTAPFVGRMRERAALSTAWQAARDGCGGAVLVRGEAGIGKSRLVEELHAEIAGQDHARLTFSCAEQYGSTALHPLVDRLARDIGLRREDSPEAARARIAGWLEGASPSVADLAPAFCALLSVLPAEETEEPALASDARARRRLVLEALVSWLDALAAARPLLVVWEDLHWADPSTLELLGRVIERTPRTRMLNLLTARTEFAPAWPVGVALKEIALARLDRAEAKALARGSARGTALPDELVAHVLARADGVPLHVEELTRAILDDDAAGQGARDGDRSDRLSTASVPATLEASLMARLDRVPEMRRAAQLGAVVGRRFSRELLSAFADIDPAALNRGLDALAAAGLLHPEGDPTAGIWTFRHALIRDAAYSSLLRRRRQALHADVARVLVERFPDTAKAEPEILAHHLTEAGRSAEAVAAWLRAGRAASERLANAEAIARLRRAERCLDALPPSPERDRAELELRLLLGAALIAAKGVAAEETGAVYARAKALARTLGDETALFPANYGLWLNRQQSGRLGEARTLATEALAIAEVREDAGLLLQGHHATWTTLLSFSDLQSCHGHASVGAGLYDFDAHRGHFLHYGAHDPGVCAHNHLAVTSWFLGRAEDALHAAEAGRALADRLDHPVSRVLSLGYASWLHQYRREPERALTLCTEVIALCDAHDIVPNHRASASIIAGWATAMLGDRSAGIARILQGVADWRAAGQGIRMSYFLHLLAEALALDGRPDEARAALAQALEQIETSGESKWRPEVLRLQGDIVLAVDAGATAVAETRYRAALAAARELGASALELRAAASLARLLGEAGRTDEARAVLAPHRPRLAAAGDNADLRAARAVRDALV